jgi:hypothetical protein
VIDEDCLLAETAALALHFGWSLGEILDLEHPLRRRLLGQLERLLDTGDRAW